MNEREELINTLKAITAKCPEGYARQFCRIEIYAEFADKRISALAAQQQEPENTGMIMPHVHDLYAALGIKWGDNPFPVIQQLRDSISPAPGQQEPTEPVADWFLFVAYGEGQANTRFCFNRADVRKAYADFFTGADDEAHKEEIDRFMQSFDDVDMNWSCEGCVYSEQLYCAHVEIFKLPPKDYPCTPVSGVRAGMLRANSVIDSVIDERRKAGMINGWNSMIQCKEAITRAADQVNADQPADAVVVPMGEVAWLRKFINCVPFGADCPVTDIDRAHSIVTTLLRAAQEGK